MSSFSSSSPISVESEISRAAISLITVVVAFLAHGHLVLVVVIIKPSLHNHANSMLVETHKYNTPDMSLCLGKYSRIMLSVRIRCTVEYSTRPKLVCVSPPNH